jgi:hypothetical protein
MSPRHTKTRAKKPRRRLSSGEREHAREMYREQMSMTNIAAAFGVSKQAISLLLRDMRMPRKPRLERSGPYQGAVHSLMQRATNVGYLVPRPCAVCGLFGCDDDGNRLVDAHHPDYSQPLDVMWLCDKHHQDWHRNNVALHCNDFRNIEAAEEAIRRYVCQKYPRQIVKFVSSSCEGISECDIPSPTADRPRNSRGRTRITAYMRLCDFVEGQQGARVYLSLESFKNSVRNWRKHGIAKLSISSLLITHPSTC